MRVLISGASIAGPVLAYWLTQRGFDVTVVERAREPRKTGGHAVDLFLPAMEISERMGVADRILERATGTEHLIVDRPGASRPTRLAYLKLMAVMSDRHVEIMRDDLSEIYYQASRKDVEYLFGDQITAITEDGEVSFAHAGPRNYDVIVGADGLHSGVRRLVFGEQAGDADFLGACLSVVSVPKSFARDGESVVFLDVDRYTMTYTASHISDARAVFMFRLAEGTTYDHHDIDGQKDLLRQRFTGLAPYVDQLLGELDSTPAFYFDSITQLQLTRWSRGRVTLVGDAGYCPGPAVGGSTSLAVLGAYVLAGELERAEGNYAAAFEAYEQVMREPVMASRRFARAVAKGFLPSSHLGVRALVGAARLVSVLPTPVISKASRLNDKGARLYESMEVPDYPLRVN